MEKFKLKMALKKRKFDLQGNIEVLCEFSLKLYIRLRCGSFV